MTPAPQYTAEIVSATDGSTDIRIHIEGKKWHLWGRNGFTRETGLADAVSPATLPVLIGSGLGHCIRALLGKGFPVAVVDKESPLLKATGLRDDLADHPDLLWLDDLTAQACLDRLGAWQAKHNHTPLSPIVLPLYLRLDREHYGTLAEALKPDNRTNFWSQARYPKFQSTKPRILFFNSNYFLCGEILSAMHRLDIEHRTIALDSSEKGSQAFIETLLRTVVDFRPDFVLTVNHFGLDREGKLSGLLDELGLPLVSWFVDNPHLILHQYAHPGTDNTVIFTYDAGNLNEMRDKGFGNVHYLPLATDPERFCPDLGNALPEWRSDISFVGNSMTRPVANCLRDAALPKRLAETYKKVATEFGDSGETSVMHFLAANRPEWVKAHAALPTPENRLAMESLITWEATRQYRLDCIRQLLGFTPLIVGDRGWKDMLPQNEWRHLPSIDYYADLPRFYPASMINFNCTSRQMPGAVNQRVFDIPACGGFVLSDYREQMENLFDLEAEAVVYQTPAEIPGLIEKFLNDHHSRKKIMTAARKRILAEHTYVKRLECILTITRASFQSKLAI